MVIPADAHFRILAGPVAIVLLIPEHHSRSTLEGAGIKSKAVVVPSPPPDPYLQTEIADEEPDNQGIRGHPRGDEPGGHRRLP